MASTAALDLVINLKGADEADTKLGKLSGTIGTVGKVAGAAALGGVVAVGGGFVAAAVKGLTFNKRLEEVTAQLNAFTKDGAVSADILDMIRERAAKTPFEFDAMASAAAGLLPASKMANESLESIISTAEVLAASNPAEGLEGAAFAIREAVSGDFASAIECFNLPRSMINKLKEEGVPNIEIVRRAMQEMGYDTELVSNMAETAGGRWSTFQDTLTGLFAAMTGPLFEGASSALGTINAKLSDPAVQASLSALAETVGQKLGAAFQWLTNTVIPGLIAGWNAIRPAIATAITTISDVAGAIGRVVGPIVEWITNNRELIGTVLQVAGVVGGVFVVLQTVAGVVASVVSAFGAMSASISASGGVIAAIVAVLGGPLTIALAAIAGAVGVFYLAWTRDWGGIRTTLTAWWNETGQPIFNTLREWLVDKLVVAVNTLKAGWEVAWPVIKAAVAAAWEFISGVVFPGLVRLFNWAVDVGLPILRGAWELAWPIIKTAVETVYTFLKDTVWPWLVTNFNWIKDTALPAVRTAFETAWPAIRDAVSAVYTWLKDTFIPFVQTSFNDVKAWLTDLKQGWDTAFGAIRGFINDAKSAWNEFTSTIQTAVEKVKGWINTVRGTFDNLGDTLSGLAKKIPSWLIPGSPTPLELGLRGITAAALEAERAFGSLFSSANTFAQLPILQPGGSFAIQPFAPGGGAFLPNLNGGTRLLPGGGSFGGTPLQPGGSFAPGTNNTWQPTINVYQQPGEDQQALVNKVIDEMRREQRVTLVR